MLPFTIFFNKFFAIATILVDIFLVYLLVTWLWGRLTGNKSFYSKIADFFYDYGLLIGFLIALGNVLGSLYYSEIAGFAPCALCWWQRIFMYPQVVIWGLGWWYSDRRAATYSLVLSVFGILVNLDQQLFIFTDVSLIPCSSSVAALCNKIYVSEFGYVTIPMMALTSFLLLVVVAWFAKEKR